MKTGGSHGKGQVEIVRYKANVSVGLRGPARPKRSLAQDLHLGRKNDYDKTERREVDSLAYLRSETVQPMGVSSSCIRIGDAEHHEKTTDRESIFFHVLL